MKRRKRRKGIPAHVRDKVVRELLQAMVGYGLWDRVRICRNILTRNY